MSGSVSQDPKAGTVTYTLDLNGPPRGAAILFASFSTLPTPLQLPGIGILDLHPASLVQIAVVPIPLSGMSRFNLTLPYQLADQGICFQPLWIDRSMNLRLTRAWGFDAAVELMEAEPRLYAGSWSAKDGNYCFVIGPVNKGDNISIAVNNQPAFAAKAKKTGRLKGCFRCDFPFRRGTVITIYRNMKPWKRLVRR